jgi:cyclopropane fatty-acyl-phospholipid synthase-like methyltransferase
MAESIKIEKLSLKCKLRAWWEGYDPDEYLAHLNGEETAEEITPIAEEKKDAAKPQEVPEPTEDFDSLKWTEKRIELAQLIWGDGYCGPGGPEHVKNLAKMLCMTDQMSVAVIGAGLGGPTRVLAEEFSSWISGYEVAEELVEKGNNLSMIANLKDKAVLVQYNTADEEPFDRMFDRFFVKETLYTITDKPLFIKKMYDKLKKDGLILITDYCLSNSESMVNPDVQKWIMGEPITPHFVPESEMSGYFENAGFTIRVDEDISEDYVNIISTSWAGAEKIVATLAKKGEIDSIQTLMKDAEFWNLRSKLLSEGYIQVRKYLVHKSK